jgi:hypothetical protein
MSGSKSFTVVQRAQSNSKWTLKTLIKYLENGDNLWRRCVGKLTFSAFLNRFGRARARCVRPQSETVGTRVLDQGPEQNRDDFQQRGPGAGSLHPPVSAEGSGRHPQEPDKNG